MAGKGPQPRPIDRKGWDESPLWRNREKRLKEEEEKKNGRLRSK